MLLAQDDVFPRSLTSISALAKCLWRIKSAPSIRFTGSTFRLGLCGICSVSGKWSVSVRIGGLFYINYYENYENDIVGHEIVRIPSYRSNLFSTQTFQELLFLVMRCPPASPILA